MSQTYDEKFYAAQRDGSLASAEAIIPHVLKVLRIGSVIDVGCGVGGWLAVFKAHGVAGLAGFDTNQLPDDAYFLDAGHIRRAVDFTDQGFRIAETADLAVSLEVAEHLPEAAADNFIGVLTAAAPIVLFSAALPHQTGVNHVNEQPPWYWRDKFNARGFVEIDWLRPVLWKDDRIAWWYRQNMTMYVRQDFLDQHETLAELAARFGQRPVPSRLTLVNEWVLQNILEHEAQALKAQEEAAARLEAQKRTERAQGLALCLQNTGLPEQDRRALCAELLKAGLVDEANAVFAALRPAQPKPAQPDTDGAAKRIAAQVRARSASPASVYDHETPQDIDALCARLEAAGVRVERATLDIQDFLDWQGRFDRIKQVYKHYSDVEVEKLLEHYLAYTYIPLAAGDSYIDVAAAGSIWVDALREKGVDGYRLDLSYPAGLHGNNIGCDAAASFLGEGAFAGLSLQCAFETFQGDADMRFLPEAGRILRPGGSVVVAPLYLDAVHSNISSPHCDLSSLRLDDGAVRLWRPDEYVEPFSRHYSPEAFAQRVNANSGGLQVTVRCFTNLDALRALFPGQRIYCNFMLHAQKPAAAIAAAAPRPKATVVIPTRNRAKMLAGALEALTKQTMDLADFECIIADNGSTDDTREVCRAYAGRFGSFTYLHTEEPGLHHGRHAGWKHASSEILLFLDDDAIPLPTWVEGMVESFADWRVGLATGKILPQYEKQPPAWVESLWDEAPHGRTLPWYTLLDFGDTARLVEPQYVWGANFGIRKVVLDAVGGFHPDAFPKERIEYRGDGESAVAEAVQRLGLHCAYNPKASVLHWVTASRMDVPYLQWRAYAQGVSDSYSKTRRSGGLSGLITPARHANELMRRLSEDYAEGHNFHQLRVIGNAGLFDWIMRPHYVDETPAVAALD